LREHSISFTALGGSQLTDLLRTEPIIVDDFFDRPWVRVVTPDVVLQTIGSERVEHTLEIGARLAVNDDALAALEATRQDTDASISFEATIGWVEGLMARGALETQHVQTLVTELDAVGPDYEARRPAAAD